MMHIADNVLAVYLQQVFWISGTACSGKTTVASALATKHGLGYYSADEMYDQHLRLADPEYQPSMCRQLPDLRSWFNQPLEQYYHGLNDNFREELDMIIIDAICLSRTRSLIVEGGFDPGWLQNIVPTHRFAFLYASPELVRRDFFDREDKQNVLAAINALPDAEQVREHVLDVVEYGTCQWIEKARSHGVKMLERTDQVTVEQRVELLAKHFRLGR